MWSYNAVTNTVLKKTKYQHNQQQQTGHMQLGFNSSHSKEEAEVNVMHANWSTLWIFCSQVL